MNINGRNYNFGRCLKVEFYKTRKLESGKLESYRVFVVEHAPEANPDNYVAMDVTVKDIPSPTGKNKPGYQGTITIYNPAKELLNAILLGVNIFTNANSNASDINSSTKGASKTDFIDYYNNRLQARVSAGYMSKDNKSPVYSEILWGYVNGSSFAHKGLDDVLTLGVFNINFGNAPINKVTTESTEEEYISAGSLKQFQGTWHQTLEHYIQNFAQERIPDKTQNLTIDYITSTPNSQRVFPLADEGKQMTYATQMPVPVSDFDRKNTSWFKIWYVKMPEFLNKFTTTEEGTLRADESSIDYSLSTELRNLQLPSNGGITGDNLATLIDGLCGQYIGKDGTRLGWKLIMENVSKNNYLIYRLGKSKQICKGEKAEIKIWNYQNLLESPSIAANGQMTVKMVFNPACVCLLRLALMLDKSIGETDVTRDVGSFVESKTKNAQMIGSMAGQTSFANFAINQITGNTFLANLANKASADADKKGYLFNRGFPIISVEHKLSTYGKDWTTTVKTIPTLGAGVDIKG